MIWFMRIFGSFVAGWFFSALFITHDAPVLHSILGFAAGVTLCVASIKFDENFPLKRDKPEPHQHFPTNRTGSVTTGSQPIFWCSCNRRIVPKPGYPGIWKRF